MDLIESFTIDHNKLEPGLYVSRKDAKDNVVVTTFDLRFTRPNREPVMDIPAMHTIEHLGATYLRNSKKKLDIVYFGPMGCRTGFYLLMFGDLTSEEIYNLVRDMCVYILKFKGAIPGAKAKECGNFQSQDLEMAKYYISKYLDELTIKKRFTY